MPPRDEGDGIPAALPADGRSDRRDRAGMRQSFRSPAAILHRQTQEAIASPFRKAGQPAGTG